MKAVQFDRGRAFAQIVYQVLIVEKVLPLEATAQMLQMGYDALYSRVNGRTPFTADEISGLIALIPDPRLIGYILKHSNLVAVERAAISAGGEGADIMRATHRFIFEATDVLEVVDEAFRDGRIDHREALLIKEEICAVERALLTLREHVYSLTER